MDYQGKTLELGDRISFVKHPDENDPIREIGIVKEIYLGTAQSVRVAFLDWGKVETANVKGKDCALLLRSDGRPPAAPE